MNEKEKNNKTSTNKTSTARLIIILFKFFKLDTKKLSFGLHSSQRFLQTAFLLLENINNNNL